MEKISAVYKITNTVTGEFYIGSSKNVKRRWRDHRCSYNWKRLPNLPLYQDMQKYGVDKFKFEIVCSIMPECLKQVEQDCIELMKPSYNQMNAKGLNVERDKKRQKEYRQSEKGKDYNRKQANRYYKTEKGKEARRRAVNKNRNLFCLYNGETLKFNALVMRFHRAGVEHPGIEAKKYLIITPTVRN